MAATDDLLPRFFKVFISHLSSDSMMIPLSYYDELPSQLPKTAILQGTGGCVWKVAMKEKHDEIHFEKGWTKFVKDNSLVDGDFLTFVYDGDCVFEVSIYGLDTYKETRAVATEKENEKQDNVITLSSEDEDTEKADIVGRSINKGKSKVEVEEDSDDTEEDNVYHLSDEEDTDTSSDFEMADVVPKTKKKGKKKVEDSESYDDDDDSDDSDYVEALGNLDVSDDSNSDSSYSLDIEHTTATVKAKVTDPEKRVPGKRMKKVKPKIKNPEAYLDNPSNIHFETSVKNRKYELLVHAQLVKDYCLKFEDYIDYMDKYGKLSAKTARWKDERVCIKRWIRICTRNKLQRNDRILCELLRKQNVVYAIKIHIVRARFL